MNATSSRPGANWYGTPGTVDHWFWGVFEGGGAKGVAYIGALEAMKARKCWFKAVAGASAGAITATLVACGLSPDDERMKTATDDALKSVRTGAWAGIRRLRDKTGYFNSDALRAWLDDLLAEQVGRPTGEAETPRVTFADLFAVTGIELNVVAADVSLRRQVIFSHHETPNCAVADAVVASSSIPFAFQSRLLQIGPDDSADRSHHTIVDGGVWSNFPVYIFEDTAFRKYYTRTDDVPADRVLGFLLKEGDAKAPATGPDVKFVDTVNAKDFRPIEWRRDPRPPVLRSSFLSKVGAALLYPFHLLGRFVDRNGGIERGRWPTPSSRAGAYLVDTVNGLLGGIHPILFAAAACVIVGYGAWRVGSGQAAEQIEFISTTDWTEIMSYVGRTISLLLVLALVAICILLPFVVALGVTVNHILLRALRRVFYGVVTTYVAGPGAPDWVENRPNVVLLPIPPTVTTLSFDMAPKDRAQLIETARQATAAKLDEVLT